MPLIETLLKLRHPDLRHQITLVDVDRALQRSPLALRGTQSPLGGREVHPQRRFLRIGLRRCSETQAGIGEILSVERDQSQQVQRLRFTGVTRQRLRQQPLGLFPLSAPPHLDSLLQQTPNRHVHISPTLQPHR